GGLGEQLLGPRAEGGDARVRKERQLVSAGPGEAPDRQAEMEARIEDRIGRPTRLEHLGRRIEQGVDVDADERGWREAHVGERRVAAADVRRVEEPLAQLL